jgi:hypothetical protein
MQLVLSLEFIQLSKKATFPFSDRLNPGPTISRITCLYTNEQTKSWIFQKCNFPSQVGLINMCVMLSIICSNVLPVLMQVFSAISWSFWHFQFFNVRNRWYFIGWLLWFLQFLQVSSPTLLLQIDLQSMSSNRMHKKTRWRFWIRVVN